MKTVTKLALSAALAFQIAGAPARANDDAAKVIAGAIAVLGVAALAHNQNHYHDGYKPADSDATARFERGYRDGLHNEPYSSNHNSIDYANGYDAGQKERQNRLAYKTRNIKGTIVPAVAVKNCVQDAASSMSVGTHDVHVIKAGQEGADNFYIELASGHRHFVCAVNSEGQIFDTRYGTL